MEAVVTPFKLKRKMYIVHVKQSIPGKTESPHKGKTGISQCSTRFIP